MSQADHCLVKRKTDETIEIKHCIELLSVGAEFVAKRLWIMRFILYNYLSQASQFENCLGFNIACNIYTQATIMKVQVKVQGWHFPSHMALNEIFIIN